MTQKFYSWEYTHKIESISTQKLIYECAYYIIYDIKEIETVYYSSIDD